MRGVVSLSVLALIVCTVAQRASAQTADTCIAFSNSWYTPARDKTLSVEIDGHPNAFWTTHYGETIAALSDDGQLLRGARFSARIYDGAQGANGGTLIAATTSGQPPPPHVSWTFAPPGQTIANARPDCGGGIWLLYVYN
jgi:hypothetical protein